MKFKKLMQYIEKYHGPGWFAVDYNKDIYFYKTKPWIDMDLSVNREIWCCDFLANAISLDFNYTGNKHWTETLREIK